MVSVTCLLAIFAIDCLPPVVNLQFFIFESRILMLSVVPLYIPISPILHHPPFFQITLDLLANRAVVVNWLKAILGSERNDNFISIGAVSVSRIYLHQTVDRENSTTLLPLMKRLLLTFVDFIWELCPSKFRSGVPLESFGIALFSRVQVNTDRGVLPFQVRRKSNQAPPRIVALDRLMDCH